MAIQAASLYSKVEADTTEAERNLGSVSDSFNRTGQAAQHAEGLFGGFNIGGIALGTTLGNLAAGAVSGLVSGLQSLAGQLINVGAAAFEATATYERMRISIESLVAREISHGQITEQVSNKIISLTEAQRKELEKLRDAESVYHSQIELKERAIDGLIAKYGEESAEVNIARHQLKGLVGDLQDTTGKIEALAGQEGKLVKVTTEVVSGQMSVAEAMKQAGPRAAELLGWIKELAIHSPFDRQGITTAFQTAMAYGFTSEQAQKLTGVMVDFAAATGKSSDTIGLVSYALGQMRAAGKVNMQDLRQLMNAGVDVESVLKKMGFTLADVGKTFIDSDKFITTFTDTMKADFGGAADRMTNSFDGLRSTIVEVGPDLLRAFAAPILEKFREPLSKIAEILTSDSFSTNLERIGKAIADGLGNIDIASAVQAFDTIMNRIHAFQSLTSSGASPLDAFRSMFVSLLPPEVQATWDGAMQKFGELQTTLQPLAEAMGNLLGALIESGPSAAENAQILGDKLKEAFGIFGPEVIVNLAGSLNALADLWRTHGDTILTVMRIAFGGIAATAMGTVMILTAIGENAWNGINGIFEAGSLALQGRWDEAWRTLVAIPFTATLNILAALDQFFNLVAGMVGTNMENIRATWQANWDMLLIIIGTFFSNLAIVWASNWEMLKLIVATWMMNVTSGLQGWIIETVNRIKKFVEDVVATFRSYYLTFQQIGELLMDHVLRGILMKVSQIIAAVRDTVTNAIKAAGDALGAANAFGGASTSSASGSASSGGTLGGVRDSGGQGEAGRVYLIGKGAQPEAFIPKTSGTFVPNADRLGGGSRYRVEIPVVLAGREMARLLIDDLQEALVERGQYIPEVG